MEIPTITFSISNQTYSSEPFIIPQPSSNSTGSFSYTSSDTNIATVDDNTVTMLKAGSVTITATQQATDEYSSGTADASFTIDRATTTITGFSISNQTYSSEPFIISEPTSNSTGSFSYSSSDSAIASVSGNTVTMLKAGDVTITATQEETDKYSTGTAQASFTIGRATTTISGFSISNKTYSTQTFTISEPTSNREGAFSYTSSDSAIATVSGNTVTMLKAGSVTITATQEETDEYSTGTADASFTIDRANPIISGFSISNKTYSTQTFTGLHPTSNSTGSFSYSSSDSAIATVIGTENGFTITMLKAGDVTITATQEETDKYSTGTAQASFTINRATTTISGFSISNKTYSTQTFTISEPTSNREGAFSYSSSDSAIATVSGNTVTMVKAGVVTITATQSETDKYSTGTAQASFTIGRANPIIGTLTIPSQTYSNGGTFTITPPSSNSTGSFSYTSSNTTIATVSGNTVTMLKSGTITITATQSETDQYFSGTTTASVTIGKANPTIGTLTIPSQTYSSGGTFTITPPSSNSTGSFSYTSSNTTIATVSGTTVTMLKSGTITITATQTETDQYFSGSRTASVTIGKANPNITNFNIPNQNTNLNGGRFTITPPTSNSTGAFSYTTSNTDITLISGSDVTILQPVASTITITANQAETDQYFSRSVSTTFTINETIPRIRILMRSLFTNNAQVYYKPHSLAPGGIGSVRNSRFKSKRT